MFINITLGLVGLSCLFVSKNQDTKICPDEKMSWNPDLKKNTTVIKKYLDECAIVSVSSERL